jgi:hypothetical protein
MALVNRDEHDQLSVVLDVVSKLLDLWLVRQDVLIDRAFGLEEALKSCLAKRHFFEFSCFVLLLGFKFSLQILNLVTSWHSVLSTIQVKHLSFDPDIGIFVRIFPWSDGGNNLLFGIVCGGMGQHSLVNFAFCEIVDWSVLEFRKRLVQLLIVGVAFIVRSHVLFHIWFLSLRTKDT